VLYRLFDGNKKRVSAADPRCGNERVLDDDELSDPRSVMYISQAERPSPRLALHKLLYTREAAAVLDSKEQSRAKGSKLQVKRSPSRSESGLWPRQRR